MHSVALSITLLALLPASVSAAGVKRRLAGQARFTDTFSLLSKLNKNPYAFNQAISPAQVSLSQQHAAGHKAAGGDDSGLGALLGGSEATAAGSDAAADAVSDSIKDLFDLNDQPKPEQTQKARKAAVAKVPTVTAPKITKPKAPPAPKAAVHKVSAAPPAPKTAAKKAPSSPPSKPKPAAAKPAAPKPVVPAAPKPVTPKRKPAVVEAKKTAPNPPATPKHAAAPKASAPQPPKAVAKPAVKKMAMVASKTTERAAALSREAQLEAELAALKAKLAQKTAQAATPVKAASPPKPVVKPPAPVVKPAVKPVTKPAAPVKAAAPKVVAKPVPAVKKAVAATPKSSPAGGKVAMASVNAALSDTASIRAAAHEFFDDSDELVGNFAAPPTPPRVVAAPAVVKAAPAVVKAAPAVVKAAPAPILLKAEPPKAPAQAAPTAPPAPEEMSMTMVPQVSAVAPRMEQSILAEPVPTDSFFGSIGNFFHRIFIGADPAPLPVPTVAPPPDPNAERPAFSKQDIQHNAEAAHLDGMADVAISDEFSRKEQEDIALIDRVKREDRALRIDAQTPAKPSMPAPSNFQHESGSTHISSFWGALAEEDADIEDALTRDGDDLTEYERLKNMQDEKVRSSVSEISGPLGEHLALERRALRKAAAAA